MIPNPNQLTAELRMMPDQQLIRFAQLHKADPYIFPMIVAEDTARKQMRAQAQAQGYRPQPTVADQAMMGMAQQPQPSAGLAALPARNIERMADGGIAGYDDGGMAMSPGMLDFAQRSEPVVRMAEGGVARFDGAVDSLVRLPDYDPLADIFSSQGLRSGTDETYAERKVRERKEKQLAEAAEAEQRPLARVLNVLSPSSKLRKALYPTQEELRGQQQGQAALTQETAPTSGKGLKYTRQELPPVSAAPLAETAPSTQARPSVTPTGATPATGIAAAPAGGAGQILDTTEQATIRRLNQMRLDAQRRADEEQIQFESGKPKGEVAAGLEAAIKKEAEAEPGEREQAKAMAIFNAGLAMMAGGSPYALQNIGAGALAGTKEYAGALKEFKQAGRERMKMQADIDQARRAEAREDNRTALQLFMRAGDRQDKIEDHMAEAGLKLGLSKADIKSKMEIAQLEQTGAMARTQVQAAAHDPLALFRALGSGDVEKGYEKAQQLKAEPMTEANLKKSWATNMALQMQYPNVQDFIRMMMSTGSPGATDTSGFKVVGVRNP